MLPTLGRIVHYRGKLGVQATRAAIVIMDWNSWIREGDVPALTSPSYVHLWVFSPNDQGGFVEYDVPQADTTGYLTNDPPPGSWTWPPRIT